jgi:hypothetical protein
MKFDNQLFYDLPEKEWQKYMETTSMSHYGLKIQQTPLAILKINQLLSGNNLARIIEIGAGDGGLSFLLALNCRIKGLEFHSYDIHDKGANIKELRLITDGFEVKDVIFNEENVKEVASLIQKPGQTLCVFDAGKKVEFNIYAKYLKPNDLCMLHDFARDVETFEQHIKGRVWNWLECTYADIKEEATKNNIVFSPWAEDCMWAIGQKK